jgi:hypothetical protein
MYEEGGQDGEDGKVGGVAEIAGVDESNFPLLSTQTTPREVVPNNARP